MNPLHAWNRFWFAPISARPLGVFRILFGLFVLGHLALISVDLDYWYTDAGLLRGDEAAVTAGPLRPTPLAYFQDPTSVRVALAITIGVAVAFTLGWRTRVAGVLLYLAQMSFYNRNLLTNCGPDQVMMITTFYMMLAPCGAAFSLDARRAAARRGTLAEPLIYPWAQRLMQLQLCLIYFVTGFLKCNGRAWLGGTAVHYVLFNHEVGQFNLEWVAGYPLVVNFMTFAALAVEFALVFLLWFRPTRRWVALLGVALHVGIWPMVNVPLFGEQMTALYLLFLDPDELAALGSFFRPSRWLGGRSRAAASDRAGASPRGWRQLELAFAPAAGNS
ncbi:HTTM domain-containing protein [Paludisphaera mucosa]|uniref:HTTM domain-containing protein n=1 Tax=Paludisphaera mucosa TaxID=3030827 RepID=A0ABT6FBQ1_9BACT|nr:HTTM domain-containing protein [Paludisphaera mucosa]MDG3004810.1 HTTM domain-containing protein [Paludisphaera mucosa]